MAVNWWFGPKDRTMLATAPDHLSQAVNFGMFSIIARPLLTILAFFHSFVGNWGIAILMLTFCIRVVFWPLSQKSFKSMEQMKKLQPMMKKLREKHKDDKEALNKERSASHVMCVKGRYSMKEAWRSSMEFRRA